MLGGRNLMTKVTMLDLVTKCYLIYEYDYPSITDKDGNPIGRIIGESSYSKINKDMKV
jgi:hypothetical protein